MRRTTSVITVLLALSLVAPASAELLLYDGFSGDDYTVGPAIAQPFAGTGFQSGGIWNNNDFAEGGLEFPNLVTTAGVKAVRTGPDMEGTPDLSAEGPFAAMIGSNGNIGGAEISGTIYYSFLAREIDGNGDGWAGFNLWDTGEGREQFGIGNPGGPDDYSIYHNDTGGDPAITDPPTPIDDQVRFFVGKIDFVGDGHDTHTAWLDPNPLLSEAMQPANIMASGGTRDGQENDGFDAFRVRGDGGTGAWEFDEVRFGTTWESVTPAVPEPATGLMSLLALGGISLLRRRR